MTLNVDGSSGTTKVHSTDELGEILGRRFDETNEFWLAHDGAKHPSLAILVRGDVACLHYFPTEQHPGFLSQGYGEELDPSGSTAFAMGGEETEIPNTAVVRIYEAVESAKEFLVSNALPRSTKWLEL